ncbi:glycine cleavage system T [Chlorella sorokiniana]|uniref:Glycine cleavage system T n=1 Tax=Chlorella sorokiniana TaxID=3076 RepID=A0A2P6TE19_CHLSO|nr:glycine cleavage system T [Chlorella sorokiniana]|eukprot:PRW20896.1 glycine cleavage system T [Chlorella sorokiniana]
MESYTRVAALAALLLLLCAGTARAMETACDDGMDADIGTDLKKATNPAAASVRWATPFTSAAISSTSLNQVFRKKNCKLVSYTVKKLCVPKSGKPGSFRVKVNITSTCGTMFVKYRITVQGSSSSVEMWGRSAS